MRRFAAIVLALVATLALLELGAIALARSDVLVVPRPHHGNTGFWWHDHPTFGAWHHPDSEGDHNGACYKARYETNDVGARDVDRPERAASRRVVVLGDSFLEGYGVNAENRFSNLLERETGVPHLNFAMAGFGPYQQLLVYEALAKRYDHEAVIVSIFPGNDFADLDPRECAALGDPDYCYRPFLVDSGDGFEHHVRRESGLRRQLRLHSQAWNALAAVARGRAAPEAGGTGSRFYDFAAENQAVLEAVLERFVTAAAGKELVLLLIPKASDLAAFLERGPAPLSGWLAGWAERNGAALVDLLPAMAQHSRRWDPYYLACDFHWSPYGNRVASELFLKQLAGWGG